MFKRNIPRSCLRKPTVVDLLPGAPYTQQIANCCRGGVLKPGSESEFEISVGKAGNSVKTVRLPGNFMFTVPKQQYVCRPAKNVRPTVFMSPDTKRTASAFSEFPKTDTKPLQICNYDSCSQLTLCFFFFCSYTVTWKIVCVFDKAT